jgi:hypothetical protein
MKNTVRKIADSGRPVVNSNMRRMSGALINHCIYRTHFVQSSVNINLWLKGKERTKMLRLGPLLNSVLTGVWPKLDAMAKYVIVATERITMAI